MGQKAGIVLRVFALLLALAALAACASCPAPEPDPCYTLVIICDGDREAVSVRRHWTETRPPRLHLLCYVKCAGTRACVSLDSCTWEVR